MESRGTTHSTEEVLLADTITTVRAKWALFPVCLAILNSDLVSLGMVAGLLVEHTKKMKNTGREEMFGTILRIDRAYHVLVGVWLTCAVES